MTSLLLMLSLMATNPQPAWNTFLGGGAPDGADDVVVDDAGNTYVIGSSEGNWGDPIDPFVGTMCLYIAKLDPKGQLLWNTFLGLGPGALTEGRAITIDEAGDVVVTGKAWEDDISNALIAKVKPSGALDWITFMGGIAPYEVVEDGVTYVYSADSMGEDIDVDGDNDIYVAGVSSGPWGDPIVEHAGGDDAFVVKLNASGELQWNTFMGGEKRDYSKGLVVGDGTIYVTGTSFEGWGFSDYPHAGGEGDYATNPFLAALTAGGGLSWHRFWGTTDGEYSVGIAWDVFGGVYVAGGGASTIWGVPINPPQGSGDAWVASFSAIGDPIWNTYVGTPYSDYGRGVTADDEGNVYIVGDTSWGQGNATRGFVVKLTADGEIVWDQIHGGDDSTYAWGVEAIGEDVYVAGETWATWGSPAASYSGNGDGYLARIGVSYDSDQANFTTSDSPYALLDGDPVQMATGELVTEPSKDLDLGGPLALTFERVYAARLFKEGFPIGSLGPNWLHNFDLSLTLSSSDFIPDYTPDRLSAQFLWGKVVSFHKVGDAWQLTSPQETVYQLQEDPDSGDLVFMDPSTSRLYLFRASDGKLMEIFDRNENRLTLSYRADGMLASVSDGLGRELSFAYYSGKLKSVSDGTRTVSYGSPQGLLAYYTDAMGEVTAYSYDTSNYLAQGPLLTDIELPRGNGHHSQDYDDEGRVSTQTDAHDHTYAFAYDTPADGTTTLTLPDGGTRRSTHQGLKLLTQEEDCLGATTSYGYDGGGRRNATTDRKGNTSSATFHEASGKLASFADAQENARETVFTQRVQAFGGVSFTFYDATASSAADGATTAYSYDGRGNLVSETDPAAGVTTYTYNSQGLALTVTNPAGGVRTFTYNPDGTVATETDTETGVTSYGHDALRRLVSITQPGGAVSEMTYDLADRITSFTDETGATTTQVYDENGARVEEIDALGETTTWSYDEMDRIESVTDREGAVTNYVYDTLGHLHVVEDPNEIAVSFEHNGNGWITEATDGEGQVWLTGYDAEGFITSRTTPLGVTTSFEVNALGRRTRTTDPHGNSRSMSFDAMSRATAVTDALDRYTDYAYDERGFLVSATTALGAASYTWTSLGGLAGVTDLLGSAWGFAYTSMGRLSSQTDPLGNTRSYGYDERGWLTQVDYATGESKTNSYDDAGRLTGESWSDGTKADYVFDAAGRMSSASTDGAAMELHYDKEWRIVDSVNRDDRFGASYDSGGRVETVSYDNDELVVTYGYDGRGFLTEVSDSLTETSVSFELDEDGLLRSVSRSNGTTTHFFYDAAQRLVLIEDEGIAEQVFTLNEVGEVTETESSLPLDPAELLSTMAMAWSYDAASQIASEGYAYDERGRLVASPMDDFTWDAAGRLTATSQVDFAYNGMGDLMSRRVDGGQTNFAYNYALDGNPLVGEEDDDSGQFTRYYVWTPSGTLLYSIEPGDEPEIRFHHFDRIGSTVFLSDGEGEITDTYAYAPYGSLLGHEGDGDQPFTFVGQYGVRQANDEGSLYHMRERFYDAVTGRFLSREPLWPQLEHPEKLNCYQYAGGNPLLRTDPTGLDDSLIDKAQDRKKLVDALKGVRDKILKLREALNQAKNAKNAKNFAKNALRLKNAINMFKEGMDLAKKYKGLSKLGKGFFLTGVALDYVSAGIRIYEMADPSRNSKAVGLENNAKWWWDPSTFFGNRAGRTIGYFMDRAQNYQRPKEWTPKRGKVGQVLAGFR